MEQLLWSSGENALRPVIVWPEHLREEQFVLPDWYEPGKP
jgi:hypothetical protein